ncbi:MAG TPA: amino acid permease [Cytophagaceae bacterium]|jgi:APA family basic amino acid/polyamine antiporter|nr:amino acid permease [Cytophagaceae bacterium]
MKTVWKTKSIDKTIAEQDSAKHQQLKRTLTRSNLILLGIGGIIGAGIFVLTGQAAATYAGPAVTISFIVAGLACAFAGLAYAEFASMIPISGSAYSYAYATLGEFIAWIIGWDLILEYMFGASTVAVGWSGYLVSFLKDWHINLPETIVNAPFAFDVTTNAWSTTGAFVNLPAVFIVTLMSTLLVIGIKESANFNNIIVAIKIVVIFLFIGFGFHYISFDNWQPFIPENTGKFGSFGISGIMRAAGVIFFAYIGFDAVSTLGQESKNPQKDMPWGILGSLVICTIIYILVGLVMTGIVSYTELNDPAPIAVAIDKTGNGLYWLKPLVKIGAIAGLSSVVLILLMGQPRIFFAMSKDGLLPPVFGKIHPKFKTPYVTTITTGIFSSVIAGLFPIDLLGELVSIGTLLAFVIVCAGVLVLRYKKPELNRPFKTPLFPYTPILGIMCSLGVMLMLPLGTWTRLLAWMGIGVVIYFLYSAKHSNLNQNNL